MEILTVVLAFLLCLGYCILVAATVFALACLAIRIMRKIKKRRK